MFKAFSDVFVFATQVSTPNTTGNTVAVGCGLNMILMFPGNGHITCCT